MELSPAPQVAKPRRKLNARQLLKVKRNRLQGRINKLRSELSQLEPIVAKLNQKLDDMNPELRKGESR
jgi:hypothetical protein